MLEEIANAEEGSLPLDERLAVLARLRESGMENPAVIDRFLVERIARLQEALSTVQEQHGELRELIRSLTAPPYFPAVFLTTANTAEVQGRAGADRRRAAGCAIWERRRAGATQRRATKCSSATSATSWSPNPRAQLSLPAKWPPTAAAPAMAGWCCASRDEEVVVLPKAALRDAGLKAGDGVRFSRSAGLAFEKIEASKGEEFFLEATPSDTFHEIGGLDREIESLKRLMTLHMFHSATAGRYRAYRARGPC